MPFHPAVGIGGENVLVFATEFIHFLDQWHLIAFD
jgi:hypothetical protein